MPEIQMPKLSDTMTEGTLVAWKKKKGDQVSAGEVLAEIETDKATMEWESPDDGTLSEIYVQEGGKVNVGDKIAFIRGEGEETPKEEEKKEKEKKPQAKEGEKGKGRSKEEEAKKEEKQEQKPDASKPEEKEKKGEKKEEKPEEPKAEEKEEKKAPSLKDEEKKEEKPLGAGVSPAQPARLHLQPEEARVKASPVARRIAAELGVDLSTVKGTGPEGRVTETDVRGAAKSKTMEPARPRAGRERDEGVPTPASARIQLSGMRKIIAQRLVESLGPVPHFYLTIDINAGPLMEAREELKSAGEGADAARITVNDFVLKAAVMAAVKVSRVNASFDNETIVQYADVDLGVAVAIEEGLLTPVIRAAQDKSLREISALAKDLAHRARNKRMKPEEFKGGTFTVSNLGGMGIDSFSAVINPPQGFILAIGKITKVPAVDHCDQIMVGHRMSITMSCDHRVIDGALGAEYLKELRHLLENPALLMV
jgi:pyruvate dehydrogenase E2 component (dihydrolipoyllysine-residue acetyltransferase)